MSWNEGRIFAITGSDSKTCERIVPGALNRLTARRLVREWKIENVTKSARRNHAIPFTVRRRSLFQNRIFTMANIAITRDSFDVSPFRNFDVPIFFRNNKRKCKTDLRAVYFSFWYLLWDVIWCRWYEVRLFSFCCQLSFRFLFILPRKYDFCYEISDFF